MKIKNIEMVSFLNIADSLSQKKLPTRLYYALSCNVKELSGFVPEYQKAYKKAKEAGGKEIEELINQEIEATIQVVSPTTLDLLDSSEKYDALSFAELTAIMFMIGQ